MRSLRLMAFAFVLAAAAGLLSPASAQTPSPTPDVTATPQKKVVAPPIQEEKDKDKRAKATSLKDLKNPSPEQLSELIVAVYGNSYGRSILNQVRRNGVENGRVTRINQQGQTEESSYEQRFIHGESFAKDKLRLDQKLPSMEYALVYNEGKIWGIINGTPFTPREDATSGFLAQAYHGIDALLRYKENGSTVAYGGRDKQKNIDLWILDLADKDAKHKTRYYVSANPDPRLVARVLWLEYEEPNPAGGDPIKYRRTFHDYRYAQSTLVPFRSVLYADGKQIEETRVSSVSYGIKMDDSYFQNPQAASN
ncbi:MAG: hypothetical protein ACJ741_00365 [Pyrinomonadaceae bacterium]